MNDLKELQKHLQARLERLTEENDHQWITKKNSDYERDFIDKIDRDRRRWRPKEKDDEFDCYWKARSGNEMPIELKKYNAQSWLNLIPYSRHDDLRSHAVVTLFLFHQGKEKRISSINIVKMDQLLGRIGLDAKAKEKVRELADMEQFRGKLKGDRLNLQYRLTAKTIKTMGIHIE